VQPLPSSERAGKFPQSLCSAATCGGRQARHVAGLPRRVAVPAAHTVNGFIFGFTMLTINADAHLLMTQFHRRAGEKSIVAALPTDHYQDWIAGSGAIEDFMVPLSAVLLRTLAQPCK